MIKVPIQYNDIDEEDLEVTKISHARLNIQPMNLIDDNTTSSRVEKLEYNNTRDITDYFITDKITNNLEYNTISKKKYGLEETIDKFCMDNYNILDYLKDESSDKIILQYIIENYVDLNNEIFKDYTIYPRYVRQLLMEKRLMK